MNNPINNPKTDSKVSTLIETTTADALEDALGDITQLQEAYSEQAKVLDTITSLYNENTGAVVKLKKANATIERVRELTRNETLPNYWRRQLLQALEKQK